MRALLSLLTLIGASLGLPAMAAPAAPLPETVVINGVEFVHIPAGNFWFAIETYNVPPELDPGDGKDHWFNEVQVWQDGFYMAKYEATARDFQRFMSGDQVAHRDQYRMGETQGCGVRRDASGAYFLMDETRNLPVTHLSHQLAIEFAHWMGFRLPTEAEWVKAARGTDRRLWPWGNEYPDDTFAGFNYPASCNAAPVDSFEKGRSPYGLYNMGGNVFEHVQDWYNIPHDLGLKTGDRNPVADAPGPATRDVPTPRGILKGGRWSSPAEGMAVYRRTLHPPDAGFVCFGVRFALDETAVRQHLADGPARSLAAD